MRCKACLMPPKKVTSTAIFVAHVYPICDVTVSRFILKVAKKIFETFKNKFATFKLFFQSFKLYWMLASLQIACAIASLRLVHDMYKCMTQRGDYAFGCDGITGVKEG